MAKIIGNTTVTPMTVPDFAQTDERKADYIKNKKISFLENDIGYAEKTYVDNKVGEIDEALEAFIDKSTVTMHFLNADNTSHTAKINTWMTWAEAIETEEVKALGMGFTIGDDGYVRCYISALLKEADYEGDVSASTFPTWCIKGTDKVKDGQVYTSSGVYDFEIPSVGGNVNWELINTITVAPDADGSLPRSIIFSEDSEGNPLALDAFYINAVAGATDGSSARVAVIGYSDTKIGKTGMGLIGNMNLNLQNTVKRFYIHFIKNKEWQYAETNAMASIVTTVNYPSINISTTLRQIVPPSLYNNVDTIKKVELNLQVGTAKTWIAGSTFELYGVRK